MNSRRNFSLRGLFIGISFLALTLALVITYWKLRQAQVTAKRLADRFGVLQVKDTSKVNVVRATNDDPFAYQWQVYIPEGTYRFCAGLGDLRPSKLPDQQEIESPSVLRIEGPQEFLFSVRICNSKDTWKLTVENRSGSSTFSSSATFQDSLDWLSGSHSTQGVGNAQQVFDSNEKWILLSAWSTATKRQPAEYAKRNGLMVWVEVVD